MRYMRCGVCHKIINRMVFEDLEYERTKDAPEYPHFAVLAVGKTLDKRLVCSYDCEILMKAEFEEKHGLKEAKNIEHVQQSIEGRVDQQTKCDVCSSMWAGKYVVEHMKYGSSEERHSCCTSECSEIAKSFFAKRHDLVRCQRKPTSLKEEAARYFVYKHLPNVPDDTRERLVNVWKAGFEATGGHDTSQYFPVGDIEGVYLMCRAFLLPAKDPLIIEVGCGTGYSASTISGALDVRGDNGRLVSYDDDDKYMGIAQENINKLTWAHRVKIIKLKNTLDLTELSTPSDLFFNDSDDDFRHRVVPDAIIYGAITPNTEVYLHDVIRKHEQAMCNEWKKSHGIIWEDVLKQGMHLARITLPPGGP